MVDNSITGILRTAVKLFFMTYLTGPIIGFSENYISVFKRKVQYINFQLNIGNELQIVLLTSTTMTGYK